MRRPGLRARVTTGFAAGALLLSATIALLSYELTRGSLLDERGRLPGIEKALQSDALATVAGSLLGTTTCGVCS